MRPWALHKLIREASVLDKSEKLVLYTLLGWVNRSGILWPSVQTIADAGSLSRRACGQILSRLVDRGVLVKVSGGKGGARPSGRGITTTYRVDAEALAALSKTEAEDQPHPIKPCADHQSGPSTSGPRGTQQMRSPVHPSAQSTARKCARDAQEPSMTPSKNSQRNLQNVNIQGRNMGGMDRESSNRRTLTQCGVKGPNLDRLAASPMISEEVVLAEWRRILGEIGLRSKTAVLVYRLSSIAGIDAGSSIRRDLSDGSLAVIGRIKPETDHERQQVAHLERLRGSRS